jgi:hypothetical protein
MVGGKTTRHKAKERLIGLQRLAELQQIAIVVVDRKLSHSVIEVFERIEEWRDPQGSVLSVPLCFKNISSGIFERMDTSPKLRF